MNGRGTGRLGRALLIARCVIVGACTSGPMTGSTTLYQPARITVPELRVEPQVAAPGAPVHIRFQLVRSGDEGAPIYWTCHLVERPAAGGTLSAVSGGPAPSGSFAEIVYTPRAATSAVVSIYPSSTPGTTVGDGSGDWRSIRVDVR